MTYTRHQLLVLIALLAAAAAGLAVRQWRVAYPELAARLEEFDRDAAERPAEPIAGAPPPVRTEPTSPPSIPTRSPARRIKLGQSAAEAGEPRLDLNRASVEDLSRLPGVGATLAARIVGARDAAGRFASVDDLRRVSGVGHTRLERLRPLVRVAE